jgi:hypothetical protein
MRGTEPDPNTIGSVINRKELSCECMREVGCRCVYDSEWMWKSGVDIGEGVLMVGSNCFENR